MDLGSQTSVVNGQRVTQPSWLQFAPQGYGPQITGVPQVSPQIPPYLGGAAGSQIAAENVGGYGTSGNNAQVAAIANANPHNWKVSPVWWVVVLLLGGLLLLNGVHWRKTTLEGFEEHAHLGAVTESGSESA